MKTQALLVKKISWDDYQELTSQLMLGSRNSDEFPLAVNILTTLDKADSKYPGVRKYYDDLSESAHPNRDGILIGYSQSDSVEFKTSFSNRWQELFGRSQFPLIELCLRIFEEEYNNIWVRNSENLEKWLETNDAELEAAKSGT